MVVRLRLFASMLLMSAVLAQPMLSATEPKVDAAGVAPTAENAPMKTALFIRNRGGKELRTKIDTFNDRLTARLSGKGFGIMDWKDVIQKFRESSEAEDKIIQYAKSFMAVYTNTDTNDSATKFVEVKKGPELEESMTGQTKDGGVAKASALRIAQMLDADYIIVATLGQLGHEKRTFKGEDTIYKTGNTADIYTLPVTIKVLEGRTGQTIYGDTLNASERVLQNAALEIKMDNMADKLIDSGAAKLADNITGKIERIRATTVKAATTVDFFLDCNVNGAVAELDGAAIGTPPGMFKASPGIHQLRLTRQYFQPWERSVNLFAGQKLAVALEFTTEGQAKFKDLTAFKQAQDLEKLEREAGVDIAKEQSKADADVKEKVSSGTEVFLKNSYIRSNNFAENITQVFRW